MYRTQTYMCVYVLFHSILMYMYISSMYMYMYEEVC